MDRWDIEKELVVRALKDPAFKERLKTDPLKTLKEVYPEYEKMADLNVTVHEEKPNEFHIALPYNGSKNELSDMEIKMLAAGLGSQNIPITLCPPKGGPC